MRKKGSSQNPTHFKIAKNLLLLCFSFLIAFSAYHAYYADKIIPGVRVAQVNLGGKTIEEAAQLLEEPLKQERVLTLRNTEKDAAYEIRPDDIELEYDLLHTIANAFLVGRSRNFLKDLLAKTAGLLGHTQIPAAYTINNDLLEKKLSQIKGYTDIPAQNAKYYLHEEDDSLQIKEDTPGRKTDSETLKNVVLTSLENLDYTTKDLPIKPYQAEVSGRDLVELKSKVEPLVQTSMKIIYKEEFWTLTPEEKLDFFAAQKDGTELTLGVDKKAIQMYQESLEGEVNVLPRGAVTEESPEGEVLKFEITEKGLEIDGDKFVADFGEAILGNKETVTIATKETDSDTDLGKYGIRALLGRGESNYTGSSASRAANLNLAAQRASGVLVPPEGTYSLSKAIGPINAGTGFNQAWVISNGRTVLGSGGGVCQTSTTLFRATLNSGLPIVERHAHAYRVSYYENDQPVGFDAAIYQPTLDLKFKNDTENYVLVQAEFLKEENKLAFRIYGTPDGREITITKPLISGVSPPPAPLYQETNTLKKGVVQQVDFAAWGGASVFSRIVKRDGETLFEETYKSSYRPWRAIFLVGTAD